MNTLKYFFSQIILSFCRNTSSSPERPLASGLCDQKKQVHTAPEFTFVLVKHAETFCCFIFLFAATSSTLNKPHKPDCQSNMACFL